MCKFSSWLWIVQMTSLSVLFSWENLMLVVWQSSHVYMSLISRRSLGSSCHGSILPAVYKAALAHSANHRPHRPADHSKDAILYVTVGNHHNWVSPGGVRTVTDPLTWAGCFWNLPRFLCVLCRYHVLRI